MRVAAGTGTTFLEFMAKNVGARRARGEFVLFTNGDVLLSDSVLEMLGREELDHGRYIRMYIYVYAYVCIYVCI